MELDPLRLDEDAVRQVWWFPASRFTEMSAGYAILPVHTQTCAL